MCVRLGDLASALRTHAGHSASLLTHLSITKILPLHHNTCIGAAPRPPSPSDLCRAGRLLDPTPRPATRIQLLGTSPSRTYISISPILLASQAHASA